VSKRGLPQRAVMRADSHYVEELTRRSGRHIGSMIPLQFIEPNAEQPRTSLGNIEELAASIREKGVLEPILVRNIAPNRYQIVSGERRYRASLAAGLQEIPCIEKEVDDAEVAEIALIENLQRKDLTAFEEAEGLQALVERFGHTHDQIAQKISKSRSSVTETLSLNSLPVDIKVMCYEAQVLSKSMLLQIVRQPSREKMIELIRRFAQGEVSRDEARRERTQGEKTRPQNYVFRFRPPTKDFVLEMKFSKSNVEKEELIEVLSSILNALKEESSQSG